MNYKKICFVQKRLKNNETLLVTNNSDLFYLTEKWLEGYCIAITKKDLFLLTSKMLATQMAKYFPQEKIIVADGVVKQLGILPLKIKKLFIEKGVNYSLHKTLSKKYKIKFCDIVQKLREIKSENEIENIRQAYKITKKVLSEVVKKFVPGITELELKNYILKRFLDYNIQPAFDPIVAFDENTAYPHHISENKKFRNNSLVMIDIGCKYNGYCCDITRMYNITKKHSDLYNQLCRLQKKLVSICRPGTKVAEVDSYARKYFAQLGLKKNYWHSTGHGVGIDVHEPPRISVKDKTVFKKGMVITIEPGIYFENKFGLRIEDDVLITSSEPKILT